MTRTPQGVGFTPDPTKWIKTTSKPKPPIQRLLVSLKNGFQTPTPSRLTDLSGSRSTPTAKVEQQSILDNFRTPPASAKPSKTALERIGREVEALTVPSSRPSPETIKKDKEDDWGSDDGPQDHQQELAIAGPSRRSRTPDIVDLTTASSPGPSPSPSRDMHEIASQAPVPIPSSNLQSRPRRRSRSPIKRNQQPGTPAGLMSSSHHSRSPPSEISEGIPITPVPASILAMHQHLCGRDYKKPKVKEPVLPKSQAKKRDVDHRAQGSKGHHRQELVQLSSDLPEEQDAPTKVLSPLRTNAMRSRHRRGGSVVETSKRSKGKILARSHTTRIARGDEQPFRLGNPAHTDLDYPQEFTERPSSPTPIRSSTPAPPTPTRQVITPRKTPHHQITPPKSRSSHKHIHEQAETLFALPAPPPRPNFAISPDKGKRKRETWDAVEMNPETLLTWSLGGSGPDSSDTKLPPQQTSPGRIRVNSRSPAQSIGPSEQSQSFPILVHSSQPVSDHQAEKLRPTTTMSAASRHETQSGKIAGDRWSHLDRGILSVPIEEHVTPTTKPPKKPRRSGTPKNDTQPKLAAFGFFSESTPRAKAEDQVFETAWENEQDLDSEDADPDDDGPEADQGKANASLRPVPEAPHHPGLRAAGIRELERRTIAREGDDLDSVRAASPPLFGEMTPLPSSGGPSNMTTPTTSSSMMDDLPGSVGNWWAGLGEREE